MIGRCHAAALALAERAIAPLAAFQQPVGAANILEVNSFAYHGAIYDERGVDFAFNYVTSLPGDSTLVARALATWVGEQTYQNYSGGPVYNILGQTGNNSSAFGLGDYQTAPRWRGNFSVTWAIGGFSLTPNVTWIGQGTINNQGVVCSESQLSDVSNICGWVVPAYFLFGLNATYQSVQQGSALHGRHDHQSGLLRSAGSRLSSRIPYGFLTLRVLISPGRTS